MDLEQARRVVGSKARLDGESGSGLIHRVTNAPGFASSAKALSPAKSLESGVVLRPIEALHQLAYATAPRYQDDLLDMYLQWGRLRYLGFFDIAVDHGARWPRLTVSEAGGRVVGNQRRVASEEIGIAFGICLARRWSASTLRGRPSISVVDVDVALDDRYVFAGGARHAVRKNGKNRPDYLLVAADAERTGRYRIRTLECKGTKSLGTALKQLAKAVRQLDGIAVDRRIPTGLATSVVAADNALFYLAIDPDDEEEEPAYPVDRAMMDDVRGFRLSEDVDDLPSRVLANAAVPASWAMLADFGGNSAALDRWAPAVMRDRLIRRPRDRERFETPFGDARGTSVTFNFEGRQLTVRHAISESVDEALGQGEAEGVIDAQARFARELPPSDSESEPGDSNELYSATTDGSIFALSFR